MPVGTVQPVQSPERSVFGSKRVRIIFHLSFDIFHLVIRGWRGLSESSEFFPTLDAKTGLVFH